MIGLLRDIASKYLRVDLRVLGLFRIFLGLICFFDVYRRLQYIEVFYTKDGLAPNYFMSELIGKYSVKSFTLLSSLNTHTEVTLFFYITMMSSLFLALGYRTKLFHIVTLIGILSIHNRLIILENGGDLVLNCYLIWSVFLPLGSRFSLDRLLNSLRNVDDSTPASLNKGGGTSLSGEPSYYWGLAYFACLLQLSIIYLFNYFNKDGSTWENGISVYYFYQLDTFLTPFGNFIKEMGLMSVGLSKIFTYSTMVLELTVPFLILLPVFTLWARRITFVAMVGFHVVIGVSLYIGTFSWVMICALILLLSSRDISLLSILVKRLSSGPYIVFYDSDCGFCHQSARILRRLDLFSHLTWAGRDWTGDKPETLNELMDSTIVVWDQSTNRVYTRNVGFSKIISSLPVGFLFAWILIVPGISQISGYIYDKFSSFRTSVSLFLGYSACDISKTHKDVNLDYNYISTPAGRLLYISMEFAKTVVVFVLILASIQYAATKNDGFRDWQEERGYSRLKYNPDLNKISKSTRMIQKWNMFSPNTPRSYMWCVIEATLRDGTVIDLQTGKAPVYDRLDYSTYSEVDNSQFWRKYFSRISKNNYKKYRPHLEKVLLRTNNPVKPYDDLNQDGKVDSNDRIQSINLYKISKSISNPLSDRKVEPKVRKYKIDFDIKSNSKSKLKK